MGNMRSIESIEVERAIVHIIDRSHDEPVLNDFQLELDEGVVEFLGSHIGRGLRNDEARAAGFDEGRNLVREACDAIVGAPDDGEAFIANSKDIARHLFRCVVGNEAVSSCDLVVCLFSSEGHYYTAVLKLDYTRTYMHNMEFVEGKFRISIVPQLVGLPGVGQRVHNCAFVASPTDGQQLLVVSKQLKASDEAQGSADAFFARSFLQCRYAVDATERTRKLKDAAEEWTRKSLKEDVEKAEGVRTSVMRALRKGDSIDIEAISSAALRNEPELRDSLVAHLEESGVSGTVEVDSRWVERHTKVVRIKTDNGICVSVPADIYDDESRFVVRSNGNGTLDIIIRSIQSYKQS